MEVVMQTKLIEHFRSIGFWAKKIEFKGIAGCPDLLIAKDGRVSTWIEVKWNRIEVTKHQAYTIKEMENAGFHVICLAVICEKWSDATFVIFDPVTHERLKAGKLNHLERMLYGPYDVDQA